MLPSPKLKIGDFIGKRMEVAKFSESLKEIPIQFLKLLHLLNPKN